MKKALGWLATVVTLAAVTVGLWYGPKAVLAHSQPAPKSYADYDRTVAKLARNHHSEATKGGAFIDNASIACFTPKHKPCVQSAHQIEVK